MPMKLSEVEQLLEENYSDVRRHVTDYDTEYNRILDLRKKEFNMRESVITKAAIRLMGITEKNYPYVQRIETNQAYTLPNEGYVQIRVNEIPLPVTKDTQVRAAEIFAPAAVPCKCWENIRLDVVKECGVEVNGDNFYKKIYLENELLDGISEVTIAASRLKKGIEADNAHRLLLTREIVEMLA